MLGFLGLGCRWVGHIPQTLPCGMAPCSQDSATNTEKKLDIDIDISPRPERISIYIIDRFGSIHTCKWTCNQRNEICRALRHKAKKNLDCPLKVADEII